MNTDIFDTLGFQRFIMISYVVWRISPIPSTHLGTNIVPEEEMQVAEELL